METLMHFLFGIAKLKADWKLENILEEELEKLRRQVITGTCASADKTADGVFVATLPGSWCIASIVTHYSCKCILYTHACIRLPDRHLKTM